MRIITAFLMTFTISITAAMAQSPQRISYQAVVRDSDDNLLANQSVGMQISILQGTPSGIETYVERHFPTTNMNGLIILEIGGGTVVSGDLAAVDWTNGPYFIRTETDLDGGSDYTMVSISQLLSVPYALHSKTAETLTAGAGGAELHSNTPTIGFGATIDEPIDSVTFDLTANKKVLILADVNIWGVNPCSEVIGLEIDGEPEGRTAVSIDNQAAVAGNNGTSVSTSWVTTLGAGSHTVTLKANGGCSFYKHPHINVIVFDD